MEQFSKKGEFMNTRNRRQCISQSDQTQNELNILETGTVENLDTLKREFLNKLSYEYSWREHCVSVAYEGHVCIMIFLQDEAVLFIRNDRLASSTIYDFYIDAKALLLQRAKQIAAAFKHVDTKQENKL